MFDKGVYIVEKRIEDIDLDFEGFEDDILENSGEDAEVEVDFDEFESEEYSEGYETDNNQEESVEEQGEEQGELEGELTDTGGEIADLDVDLGEYSGYTEDNSEYVDLDREVEGEGEVEEEVEYQEETRTESEEHKELEDTEKWFDEDEGHGEYAEDYEDAYNRIADEDVEDLESVYGFFDNEGNPVDARKRGTVLLDSIDISSVIVPTRNRTEPRDITVLEENIKNFHQVSPIHVIPYGDDGEYVLLDGLRRLHAMINLGHDKIMAYVDDTINPHAVRPFESLVNNRLQYTFSEKFKAGRFIEKRQDGFSYDTIENMIGLKTGEYLKMLFVHRMKDVFPDIYEKVILEKLTPEQAERKINKELEKADDENNLADAQSELGEEGSGEGIKPGSDRESEDPYNRQNKEERSILDSSLKTAVLTRDGGVCQCCGEGIGEPEVSQLMKIHHIVPVELFGPDRQDNLITVCANCHDKVHYYDEGRYKPDGELPNVRRNPLILGNMIQELRDEADKNNSVPIDGMEYYNESPYESYILSSYQSDFVEDAEDNVENTTRGQVHKVYSRRERTKLKNTKKDMN